LSFLHITGSVAEIVAWRPFHGPRQRASAARRALSDRCSAVSRAARARPPFSPPLRPSATAAGSLPPSDALPVARPSLAPSRAAEPEGGSESADDMRERSGMGEVVGLVLLSMIPIVVGAIFMVHPEATTRFYRRVNERAYPGIGLWNWPPDPQTARLMGLGFILLGLTFLFATFAFSN